MGGLLSPAELDAIVLHLGDDPTTMQQMMADTATAVAARVLNMKTVQEAP